MKQKGWLEIGKPLLQDVDGIGQILVDLDVGKLLIATDSYWLEDLKRFSRTPNLEILYGF